MSAHDKAVEAARMALGWVGCPCSSNVGAQFIRAYLAHMAAAGWKLTRREATKEMAISALNIPTACPVPMSEWLVELARGEWSAMHDAAPSPEEAP